MPLFSVQLHLSDMTSSCLVSQFLCVMYIFSYIDKINNFWQQKQHVLFLINMIPKVFQNYVMLLVQSYWGYAILFREKTPFFGHPWLK